MNHSGYREEELAALTFADLGPTFIPARLAEFFAPLIADPEESILLETTHKRKNGVEVPVEIFVQYISQTNANGRFFFDCPQYFQATP